MRTPAILVMMVLLGFAEAASAQVVHHCDRPTGVSDVVDPAVYLWFYTMDTPTRDFTLTLFGQRFGVREWEFGDWRRTTVCEGPFGEQDVPFTATQGLVGICLIVGLSLMLLVLLMAKPWRRRARAV